MITTTAPRLDTATCTQCHERLEWSADWNEWLSTASQPACCSNCRNECAGGGPHRPDGVPEISCLEFLPIAPDGEPMEGLALTFRDIALAQDHIDRFMGHLAEHGFTYEFRGALFSRVHYGTCVYCAHDGDTSVKPLAFYLDPGTSETYPYGSQGCGVHAPAMAESFYDWQHNY
jgi:hypothetical protein